MGSGKGKARRAQTAGKHGEFETGDKVVFTGSTAHGAELRKKHFYDLIGLASLDIMVAPETCSDEVCVVTKLIGFVHDTNELLYEIKFHPEGTPYIVAADELRSARKAGAVRPELDDFTPVEF